MPVLGIHRRAYKLVPNREVFEPFEDAIVKSDLDLDGIEVKVVSSLLEKWGIHFTPVPTTGWGAI